MGCGGDTKHSGMTPGTAGITPQTAGMTSRSLRTIPEKTPGMTLVTLGTIQVTTEMAPQTNPDGYGNESVERLNGLRGLTQLAIVVLRG